MREREFLNESALSPIGGIKENVISDTTDLAVPCRAINVATSGYVKVTTVDGDTGRIYIGAGSAFPVRARRIWSTGTTASDIVALY